MQKISDDEMIKDIQRIACFLNTNKLSLREYIENGGKYSESIIDDHELGGFANKCELAGIKSK